MAWCSHGRNQPTATVVVTHGVHAAMHRAMQAGGGCAWLPASGARHVRVGQEGPGCTHRPVFVCHGRAGTPRYAAGRAAALWPRAVRAAHAAAHPTTAGDGSRPPEVRAAPLVAPSTCCISDASFPFAWPVGQHWATVLITSQLQHACTCAATTLFLFWDPAWLIFFNQARPPDLSHVACLCLPCAQPSQHAGSLPQPVQRRRHKCKLQQRAARAGRLGRIVTACRGRGKQRAFQGQGQQQR